MGARVADRMLPIFVVMENGLISWSEFENVNMCVGTVIAVEDLPEARCPAYVLTIDFGPHGIKRSSAQITKHYTKEGLLGRQVVAVINFPVKQIGSVMSQCLVTGFADEHGDIVLTAVERNLPNGARLC